MLFNDRNSSGANIKRDLRRLRNDVAKLSEQISRELSEGGNEALNNARQRVDHIRQSLNEVVVSRKTGAVANGIAASVEESLRSHPLAALTMAIGAALIVGTTWQLRR